MRRRLRRLVSSWRKPRDEVDEERAELGQSDEAEQSEADTGRRLADAQARLKRSVPPKQD